MVIKATKFNIPTTVKEAISTINENGYEAYIVGGSVRDAILGKTPSDWDLTTSALPEQIKAIFEKTIDTGLQHGTVTVLVDELPLEITTYRTEGKYINNRKPESVSFTPSLKEDLSRRDLTINSIAYHPKEGFVDPFNGVNDIESKIIKAVGEPNKRFSEDALRMLRAIRFSGQLDFEIEPNTLNSISLNSRLIKNISAERIRVELTKLILSDTPLKFVLLKDTGILKHILPALLECFNTEQNHPYHVYDVGMHSLYALSYIENKFHLRWAALLHDIGKPISKTTDEKGVDHFYKHHLTSTDLSRDILERLKFDSKSTKIILRLIRYHDRKILAKYSPVRKAVNQIGDDIFLDLLKLKESDTKAHNPIYLDEGMSHIKKVRELYFEIKEKQQCLCLKDLAVNGIDLIDSFNIEGEVIGESLNMLLEKVIENPELNEKSILLELAKKSLDITPE